MNVWINTVFEGRYPVGTAAVVVARTRKAAADLLNDELRAHDIPPRATPDQFVRLRTDRAHALVLCDGDY